jgi:Ca2+-binding EF-hand superfamily protein
MLVDLLRFEESLSLGVANLSHGVTRRRAQQLWSLYDADGNGTLDLGEVSNMVKDIGRATLKRIERKTSALEAALVNQAASASLFNAFDTSGDGKVQHEEFIALATKGVRVLRDVVDEEDEDEDLAARATKRSRLDSGASCASACPPEDKMKAKEEEEDTPAALSRLGSFEGRQRLLMRAASFNLPPPLLMRQESAVIATAELRHGVSVETAERLWATFDKDKNGVLDKAEVHAIFATQIARLVEQLRAKASALSAAVSELSTSAKVLREMDTNGDGKVQEDEFLRLATSGIEVLLTEGGESAGGQGGASTSE